jgi:hypothetical protein
MDQPLDVRFLGPDWTRQVWCLPVEGKGTNLGWLSVGEQKLDFFGSLQNWETRGYKLLVIGNFIWNYALLDWRLVNMKDWLRLLASMHWNWDSSWVRKRYDLCLLHALSLLSRQCGCAWKWGVPRTTILMGEMMGSQWIYCTFPTHPLGRSWTSGMRTLSRPWGLMGPWRFGSVGVGHSTSLDSLRSHLDWFRFHSSPLIHRKSHWNPRKISHSYPIV